MSVNVLIKYILELICLNMELYLKINVYIS